MSKTEDIQKRLKKAKEELDKAEKAKALAVTKITEKKKLLKSLEAELVIAMMADKQMDLKDLEQLLSQSVPAGETD